MMKNTNEYDIEQMQALCSILNNGTPEGGCFRGRVFRWRESPDLETMALTDSSIFKMRAMPFFYGSRMRWTTFFMEDSEQSPQLKALQYFAMLVSNPLCGLLAGPCQRCHNFFLKRRMNHLKFCSARCAQLTSAAKATKRAAENERDLLLRSAVRYWRQWAPEKAVYRAGWIASRMNEKRKVGQRHITASWVSRNANKIQELVEKGVSDERL
ncbi:MAG: hypothetical protein ACYDBH_11690 [Acidobacteriaceae bacterium]